MKKVAHPYEIQNTNEGNFYERILLRIYELGVYHESQPLTPEIRGWWPGTAVRSVRTRRTFRHERRDGGRWWRSIRRPFVWSDEEDTLLSTAFQPGFLTLLFVFWLVESSFICKSHRLNNRTIVVCYFIASYNTVPRLPCPSTATVLRDVVIVALGVYEVVVLTRTPLVNEESTPRRLLMTRW